MVADHSFVDAKDYLAGERRGSVKHEYIDGHVYAMAGASDAHVTITLNLGALLRNHLRGGACRVYVSDMKVQVNDTGRYFYPDVLVTCDSRDRTPEAREVKKYPTLVVEVLSPSTEAFDRGRKFSYYRQIETLQEYVLIDPSRQSVESFRRGTDGIGLWDFQPYGEGDDVTLSSIDFQCSIATLYEDVMLEEPPDVRGSQPDVRA